MKTLEKANVIIRIDSQTLGDRVFELAKLANAPIVNLESNENDVIVLGENVPKHIVDWVKNG
jgi:hypothetical protein